MSMPAPQVLLENAGNYSKGMLSEILDFVMGTGLIPADGEVWKLRRRTLVPALHKKYVESMLDMFGDSTLHGVRTLEKAADYGGTVEMENYFSRLALDIIGKAVFNYDFDSLTNDDPIIRVSPSQSQSPTPNSIPTAFLVISLSPAPLASYLAIPTLSYLLTVTRFPPIRHLHRTRHTHTAHRFPLRPSALSPFHLFFHNINP
jgi:hypothetical protein